MISETAAAMVLNGSARKKAKPQQKTVKKEIEDHVARRQHEEDLAYRAKRWAELHANPKTRAKMDTQLEGLNEADKRRVVLNGQRIASGLQPKH